MHYSGYLQPSQAQQIPPSHICLGLQVKGEPINRHAHSPGSDDVLEQRADLICAEYGRFEKNDWGRSTELVTRDVGRFWQWLKTRVRSRGCTWVWSLHAYASMTVLGLWERLQTGEYTLAGSDREANPAKKYRQRKPWEGYVVCADPPTIIVLRPRGSTATIKIVDVRNFGVRDYADLVSLVQSDAPGEDWTWDASIGKSYAAREFVAVQTFVRAWIKLVQDHQLGSLQHTISGQADRAFRKRCLQLGKVEIHDDIDTLERERAALVGGRCECGRIGVVQGEIYHLDIKSAYHYAAATTPVPYSINFEWSLNASGDKVGRHESVVRLSGVTIRTDKPIYPVRVLCSRCEQWRREIDRPLATRPCQRCVTIWPIGQFNTILCGRELEYAVASGHVMDFAWTVRYPACKWLAPWAYIIDRMRTWASEHNNAVHDTLVKRLGLSLYGKFGQRGVRWRHQKGMRHERAWDTFYQIDAETGEPELWRTLAGRVERQVREAEHFRSMPIVTAVINASARMRLYEMLATVENGTVYYYDTDSIWCNRLAYEALADSGYVKEDTMGYLRLKGTCSRLEVRGIRHYVHDGTLVRAGTPLWASDTGNGDGCVQPIEEITAACIAKREPSSVSRPAELDYRERYRHGTVGPGGRVYPLQLSEFVKRT